ncbi:MAG TPA: hypothetical protein PKK26_13665, partial [Candidatus Wallbacteria bacterium]|nr:hypothetical protein [Candidatus Wallbacteria bacterium]
IKDVFREITDVAKEITQKTENDKTGMIRNEVGRLSELIEHERAFIEEFKLEKIEDANFKENVNCQKEDVNCDD